MGESVKLFEDSLNFFMEYPDGETCKDMEMKRENMFLTNRICMQTSFPEINDIDVQDAIRISKAVKTYTAGLARLNKRN